MRFSLGTLVLLVVWCAAGMMVWAFREPWYRASVAPKSESKLEYPERAPDGVRCLCAPPWGGGPLSVGLRDLEKEGSDVTFFHNERVLLFTFPNTVSPRDCMFYDDDTVLLSHMKWPVTTAEPEWETATFKRRFPEWWWGHFYRVEVWLFVLLGGVLMWRGLLSIRTWRKARSVRVLEAAEAPSSPSAGISV